MIVPLTSVTRVPLGPSSIRTTVPPGPIVTWNAAERADLFAFGALVVAEA
jgi:hypothetical protein